MATENDALAPGLLLASPALRDANFERSVVLLGKHDAEGTLGWVLNGRQLATVREMLASTKVVPAGTPLPEAPSFGRTVSVGGPVAPAAGWLIYRRAGEPLPGEIAVGAELGVTGELAAFAAVVRGDGPSDFRLVLGCAGWAPGQLEGEIAVGAWLPAAVDVALVFDTAQPEIWDQAYRRSIGAAPATFTSRPGRA